MRLDRQLADRVVDALAAGLPAGVRVRRHGSGTLVVTSKPGRFEWVSSSFPVFGQVPRHASTRDAVSAALRCAIEAVTTHFTDHDLDQFWPGLDAGRVSIVIERTSSTVVATLRDPGGHVLRLPSVSFVGAGGVVESSEAASSDLSAEELAEMAGATSEVDSVALWLLRVGIDHTGALSFTRLWDVAARGAVLADLRRSGRLTETDDHLEIDAEPVGLSYEDKACEQLLARASLTELDWLQTGRLRASDVAAHLVQTGEWTRRAAPLAPGRYVWRAPKQQYITLRRRVAHTYDGDIQPLSDAEAAIAVLGHALNVVRPTQLAFTGSGSDPPLEPEDCGILGPIISATATEIRVRAAATTANPNPTW